MNYHFRWNISKFFTKSFSKESWCQ